jgi:predicted nucleotidyltransferase
VRLFGSRARGTARPGSDLDLLVTVAHSHGQNSMTGDLLDFFTSLIP